MGFLQLFTNRHIKTPRDNADQAEGPCRWGRSVGGIGGLRVLGFWGLEVYRVVLLLGCGNSQLLIWFWQHAAAAATMKSLQTNECVMAAGRVWEYKCVLVCVLASANCAIVFVSRVCVCVYMCVCVLVCTLVTPYRTSVRSQLKVAYRVHS